MKIKRFGTVALAAFMMAASMAYTEYRVSKETARVRAESMEWTNTMMVGTQKHLLSVMKSKIEMNNNILEIRAMTRPR